MNYIKKHDEIETLIWDNLSINADFDITIALYDLTNTYFEGNPDNDDAQHGKSKEHRSDCQIISLAIMLDWSGYIRRTMIFKGNISEPKTLSEMVEALNPPKGTMFIMDRGIATADNVEWMVNHDFRYLVVNRERARIFDMKQASPLTTSSGDTLNIYSQLNDKGTEKRVFCYSPKRACTEKNMLASRMKKYEERLRKLNEGLSKPRVRKDLDTINHALGSLAKEFSGVSHYYTVTVQDNRFTLSPGEALKVIRIAYEKKEDYAKGNKLTPPGVYCIKTNNVTMSAEEIWRTYIRLTKLESAFRSLKSELGLRPIHHQKKRRINSHLFVSTLAY
jgi:transposase